MKRSSSTNYRYYSFVITYKSGRKAIRVRRALTEEKAWTKLITSEDGQNFFMGRFLRAVPDWLVWLMPVNMFFRICGNCCD